MKDPFLNTAIRAARAAGNVIVRAIDRLEDVEVREKSPNDYVTDIDQKAEHEIIRILKKAYPEHSVLGEESGVMEGNEYQWVIDPLDGTRNFIHGFPQFAVSIALMCSGRLEHGVIYDPLRQELFCASRGQGAWLNERRIRVSRRKNLEECLLGTGFPFRHAPDLLTQYLSTLSALVPVCGDVRRAGAATLDLAYVACGRLDGFWEMGLKLWDIAAGVLLIREAGGMVTDFAGGEGSLTTGDVVAGNPKILKQLLQKIGREQ